MIRSMIRTMIRRGALEPLGCAILIGLTLFFPLQGHSQTPSPTASVVPAKPTPSSSVSATPSASPTKTPPDPCNEYEGEYLCAEPDVCCNEHSESCVDEKCVPKTQCGTSYCDAELEICCNSQSDYPATCFPTGSNCCPAGGACRSGESCCGDSACCGEGDQCCTGKQTSSCTKPGGTCCDDGRSCKSGEKCCMHPQGYRNCIDESSTCCANGESCSKGFACCGSNCCDTSKSVCCGGQCCGEGKSCYLNQCRVIKICGEGCRNWAQEGVERPCCNFGFDNGRLCTMELKHQARCERVFVVGDGH
ncbi:MAG: hypothetical protein KDD60_07525 [Bdellovibrionales bacterium]|nr:hypothetical protein [Bdellovibrionales bacterium]